MAEAGHRDGFLRFGGHMALQDLAVANKMNINPISVRELDQRTGLASASLDGSVHSPLSRSQIRRFLTGIGKSDNYQVALVSSTRAGAPGRDSVHTRILLLPVTWKDVSELLGEHR